VRSIFKSKHQAVFSNEATRLEAKATAPTRPRPLRGLKVYAWKCCHIPTSPGFLCRVWEKRKGRALDMFFAEISPRPCSCFVKRQTDWFNGLVLGLVFVWVLIRVRYCCIIHYR